LRLSIENFYAPGNQSGFFTDVIVVRIFMLVVLRVKELLHLNGGVSDLIGGTPKN
jgi:hypothetical protein